MSTAVHNIEPVLQELIDRASNEEAFDRFEEQMRFSGYCERPVRLRGRVEEIDQATGQTREVYRTADEPDGTLLKACGQRRESVCRSCAYTYRGDAYQIVASGLRGGKGVPETVREHPTLFVTLTAPSFGAVHTASVDERGRPKRCRPRRRAATCPHGVRLGCWERHAEDDQCVGEPFCRGCFDYEQAVIWNAVAPELWRRTTIYITRALARRLGVTQTELRRKARLSYTKVAEFQRRGALHFHAVIRVDGVPEEPSDDADVVHAPPKITEVELEAAIRDAIGAVRVANPLDDDRSALRWGPQIEIEPVGHDGGQATEATAAYLAKYATKSTEPVGGLTQRVDGEDLCSLRVRPHVRRLIETAWQLGGRRDVSKLRLRRSAHMLGFRGHWSTKSRRYSTTFSELRAARARWAAARRGGHCTQSLSDLSPGSRQRCGHWRFVGIGYLTSGDAWLARTAAARAREQRRIAREELADSPPMRAIVADKERRIRWHTSRISPPVTLASV